LLAIINAAKTSPGRRTAASSLLQEQQAMPKKAEGQQQ
jgi:hypothetical protein